MKNILILLLIVSSFSAAAQDIPVIEIDSVTGHAKGVMPYDRPFILKVKADKKPPYIDYLTSKKNVSWETMLQESVAKEVTLPTIPPTDFWLQKDGKISYLYIRFGYYPYYMDPTGKENNMLRPSRNISVIIPAQDEKGFDILHTYHKSREEGQRALKDFSLYQLSMYGATWNIPDSSSLDSLYSSLKIRFVNIDTLTSKLETAQSKLTGITDTLQYQKKLLALIIVDTSVTKALKYEKADLIKIITNLEHMTTRQQEHLLKGEAHFLEIEANDSEKISNLTKATNQLQQLKLLHYSFTAANLITDSGNFWQTLTTFNSALDSVLVLQKEIKKEKDTIKSAIAIHFVKVETATGTSNIFSFETRSALRIIPDFGLVYYGFQDGFQGITPYLGFQVNLRSMDKNIPFQIYPNKKLLHRLTLGLGYTLISLSETGKRDDFFDGKGALMIGAGIKFNHAMKVTAGTMWFQKEDPNPIISKKTQAFTPYLGLSIDLDVKKFFNDFATLIPKK